MAQLRRLLFLVIGVISGAWVGADALRKSAAHAVTRADERLASATVAAPPVPLRRSARAFPGKSAHGPDPAAVERGKGKHKQEKSDDKPVSAPGAQVKPATDAKTLNGPFAYLKELFKRFGGDHCPAWAASLSFFSILSIAPVLICGIAVLGFVVRSPKQATKQVVTMLANVLPGDRTTATEQAQDLVTKMNLENSVTQLRQKRGVTGVIGLLSLFWSAMQIFLNAATPMNAAFRTEESRGFIKLRLVALGLLIGAGLLFLLSLLPSAGVPFHLPFLAVSVIGIAINAVMFTIIYKFLPSPSSGVTWRSARFAGIIVAVLWEAAKQGFAIYLQQFGQAGYNKVYGSLGGLIALIFWIYYTSMILLLGAEIAKLYQDMRAAHGEPDPDAAPVATA